MVGAHVEFRHVWVRRVGKIPLWGERATWEKQLQRSKPSWILMTSGWFYNSCFWLATPMQTHFHTALKFSACTSYRTFTAFSTQAEAPRAYSYLYKAGEPNSGAFQNVLEKASLQCGSLSELYRVCVKSNATRKALWEVIFLWHVC